MQRTLIAAVLDIVYFAGLRFRMRGFTLQCGHSYIACLTRRVGASSVYNSAASQQRFAITFAV